MVKSKNFKQNQIVRFTKKAAIFDLENKTKFIVPKGTTARVVLDQDVGEIGSCKIKLKKKDGRVILAEIDDKYLQVVD